MEPRYLSKHNSSNNNNISNNQKILKNYLIIKNLIKVLILKITIISMRLNYNKKIRKFLINQFKKINKLLNNHLLNKIKIF